MRVAAVLKGKAAEDVPEDVTTCVESVTKARGRLAGVSGTRRTMHTSERGAGAGAGRSCAAH